MSHRAKEGIKYQQQIRYSIYETYYL